jgi:hypothetical protein
MKHRRAWMLALVFVAARALLGDIVKAQTVNPIGSAGYRIAGTAVDAVSGQPLARVEVSIELQEDKKVHEAYTTGTDGRFSFEGLAAGRYVLVAGRRGYVKQTYKFHEGGLSTAIVVGEGLKTDQIRIAMKLGGSIVGQVLDERGDAVRNARVMLLREMSTGKRRRLTRARSKMTNDLGVYRFGHLSAGVYVVGVMAHVWYADASPTGIVSTDASPAGDVDTDVVYPVTFYPSALDAEVATRITVTAGENITANVAIAPVRAQHAMIPHHASDWKSLGTVDIKQYIAEGVSERADVMWSVSENEIRLDGLRPSRIDVVWTNRSGKAEEEHLTTLNLTGRPSGEPGATVIRGGLEVENGMKPAGMTVKLDYMNGGKTFAATTGANGEFEFREEMVGGEYSVEVAQMAGAAIGIRAEGTDVTPAGIEVQPGRDVELKVVAGKAARVRGRVVKSGVSAEGVLVALVPDKFEEANNLMRVDQSDSDGSFRLENVVPGKYTLIALENAWDADWRSAEFLGRFVGEGKKLEIGNGVTVTTDVEVQDRSGK